MWKIKSEDFARSNIRRLIFIRSKNIWDLFITSYTIVSKIIGRILDFISITLRVIFFGFVLFWGVKLLVFLGLSALKLISENSILILLLLIFFVPIYLVCELCNRNFWSILAGFIILSIIGLIAFGIFKISLLLGIIITPIAFFISIPALAMIEFSKK